MWGEGSGEQSREKIKERTSNESSPCGGKRVIKGEEERRSFLLPSRV
jgi:hypothetical protein